MKFAFKPIAIAAALAFIGTAAVASPMKPGTYTAKVNGHNAPLTVAWCRQGRSQEDRG